ncbi:DUF6318 family protein [Janibacter indicus]
MQLQRSTIAWATALVIGGTLAGCGGNEPTEPTTAASANRDSGSPASSESSSATGSATSSGDSSSDTADLPTDLPAEARKESKEGAAAFGKYYYEAFGDASHTGRTTVIEQLDSKDCGVCGRGVRNIQSDAEKGWTRSVNPYTIRNVEATKRPDLGYEVTMRVNVVAHERIDADGKANGKVRAADYTLTEHLVWENGRWHVLDWLVT